MIGLSNILLTSPVSSAASSPTKVVDPVPHYNGGDGPSVVFDKEDTWHLVYGWIDGSGTSFIVHRTSKGTNETLATIGGSDYVSNPGLAIDSKDKLYVFYRSTHGSIYLINNSAGAWSAPFKLVNPVEHWSGDSPSAVFDKDGAWHMVYGWINSSTNYITHLSSTGVRENIVTGAEDSCSSPDIAIDPSGKMYVSYRGAHGSVLGMEYNNGNWSVPLQLVDPVPWHSMGDHPSSVFDKDGKGHMVYGWINSTQTDIITYIRSNGMKKDIIKGEMDASNPDLAINSMGDMLVFCRGAHGSIYSMVVDKPPNIPPSVTQTSPPDHSLVGGTDVNLTWSGSDQDGDILGYYVFLDDVNGHTLVGYLNVTTYHATGLKDGTKYYWTVIPNDRRVNGTSISGITSFTVHAQQGTPIIALWVDIQQPNVMLTLGGSVEVAVLVNCIGADIKSVHLQDSVDGKLHLQVEQLTGQQDIKAGVPVTFKTKISLKGGDYRSTDTGHVGITALGDGIDSPTKSVLVTYDRKNSTIPKPPDVRPVIAAVGIGATVLAVSLIAGTEIGLLGAAHLFMPLISKKDEKGDKATRGKIQDYLMKNPGDHYSQIKKGLDPKYGPLTYNLLALEQEGRIVSSRDGIYKRFYPKDAPVINRNDLTYMQHSIVDHIRKEPGISQAQLAKRMTTSGQVIDYHVRSLKQADIITLKKEGKTTRCFLKDQGP